MNGTQPLRPMRRRAASCATSLEEYEELLDHVSWGHLPELMRLLGVPDSKSMNPSDRRVMLRDADLEQISKLDIARWNAWVDEENVKLAASTARKVAAKLVQDKVQTLRDARHSSLKEAAYVYRT